jgi:hypothetical protein
VLSNESQRILPIQVFISRSTPQTHPELWVIESREKPRQSPYTQLTFPSKWRHEDGPQRTGVDFNPQAASVGSAEATFSATAPVSDVAKTTTYTRAYDESNGFITLLSDGERLTGAYALGRVVAAGHSCDPRPRAARSAARHDPAVPHVLRDLYRLAESPPWPDHDSATTSRGGDQILRSIAILVRSGG